MRRIYSDADVIIAVMLRYKGMSYRDIARRCSLSPSTVQKIVDKYSEPLIEDIVALLTKTNRLILSKKTEKDEESHSM